MIRSNKVLRNASWIVVCRVLQSLIGFVISLFTARYLGPSNYGLISYASSLVLFVTPIMSLGLPNTLVQEIIERPEKEGEILGTSMLSCSITSLFCIVGVTAFSYFSTPNETETIIVCALFSISLFFQAMELTVYWFQAKLLSKFSSLVSLSSYLLVSAYKFYLLSTQKSVYWFSVAYAIDYALISIGLLWVYRKQGGQKLRFSFGMAKALLDKSRFYIVSGLMVTIFTQTDKIMIKMMLGSDLTGYYSAALLIASLAGFLFAAIIDSFRPIIFESKKKCQSLFEKNLTRLYCVVIYASVVQSILMTSLAKVLIQLLYGESYISAVNALRILPWYTVFAYLGTIRNVWMLAESKQKYLWIINSAGAAMNVILNYLLIPYWGISGAAIASLAAQVFANVIMSYILKPLRYNNTLIVRGLHPSVIIEIIQSILRSFTRNGKE